MKKYIAALIVSLFFCIQINAQVTIAYKKEPRDTNRVVYDEQGNALRYYQFSKLVNSGDYTIRYNGRPGDPGVQGRLVKLDDDDRARMLKIIKEHASIKSATVKEGNMLDIKPLQNALDGVDFTNKVVVLVFWNSGCDECTENFAGIDDFLSHLSDPHDVVVVSITIDDKVTAIATLKQTPLLNARLITSSNNINADYDINNLPAYIVADKSHIIRLALANSSPVTLTAIKTAVTSALAK